MHVDAIHDEICTALVKAGGTACEDLIVSGSATKADVAFEPEFVITEVKTFTSDRIRLESVRKGSGRVMAEAAKSGGPVLFGTCSIPASKLPPKLISHLGQRVQKDLRKANQQISETAKVLGWKKPGGIVVFGVPAHFSLHAGFISTVAAGVLDREELSSIDSFLIISVPSEGAEPTNPFTISYHARGTYLPRNGLVERMANAWINHLEALTGQPTSLEPGWPDRFKDVDIVDDNDWPKAVSKQSDGPKGGRGG